VVVVRNTCAPEVPQLYEVTVPENKPVNNEVVRVQATDCDSQFSYGYLTYTLIGDDNGPVSRTIAICCLTYNNLLEVKKNCFLKL